MQKLIRLCRIVFVAFVLLVLSGCSLLLQSQSNQADSKETKKVQEQKQEEAKKRTPEEVLAEINNKLKSAPGNYYLIDLEEEGRMDYQYINDKRFCVGRQSDNIDALMCYDSPELTIKMNDQTVTLNLDDPQQKERLLKEGFKNQDISKFLLGTEVLKPDIILQVAKEHGNFVMKEQGDHYLLEGSIPAYEYMMAVTQSLENNDFYNRFDQDEDEVEQIENLLSNASNKKYVQFQAEIKVNKTNLQLEEITTMFNPDQKWFSIIYKGEISDLNMDNTNL